MTVSFIGGGNRVPRENHQPVESHLQTLSHDEYFVWELILNKYFTVDYFCMVQLLAILVVR